ILGLILFSIAIIGTMISMNYEIIDPQDCISILTGKNLCLTMQILKVLIVLCILSLSVLVIFIKTALLSYKTKTIYYLSVNKKIPTFAIEIKMISNTMKQVPLQHVHEALGAKMVPFAGFNMPIQYEGVNIEHETVRNGVGVFDVSHMGEFLLTGEKALDLIQKVSSNDASVIKIGKAQYACLPNDKGGIVDD